jgi:HD superfamily phosphohydrolase
VDSAIFRQFRLERVQDDSRLISRIFGSTGIRLDREFAVEMLLIERYAMYLKVYTHRDKAAASALLGKALASAQHPSGRGKADFSEEDYEWLPDDVVVDRLARSQKVVAQQCAQRLRSGRIPEAVFRAPLLPPDSEIQESQYERRRTTLGEQGLFSPAKRQILEAEIARAAKVNVADVLVYCPPTAPGYQTVSHRIASTPERSQVLDDIRGPYHSIREKHLRLWDLWAFTTAEDERDRTAIAGAVRDHFGFDNQIGHDRRADRLW